MLVVTEKRIIEYPTGGYGSEAGRQYQPFDNRSVRFAQKNGQKLVIALEENRIVTWAVNRGEVFLGKVPEPVESMLLLNGSPVALLIGTEGAHVYHVGEHQGLRRNMNFDKLQCRKDWFTPWGGPPAVRSMAVTPEGWVYADIHVGSIMRSWDRGETWEPVTPTLDQDVHQIAASPRAPQRVYANTAQAVYISEDRGDSWTYKGTDLEGRYGRAVAVDPENPAHILASISDGPHGDNVHGQLYRTENCGESWRQVGGDFPEATRQNINTYHVAFDTDCSAWSVGDNTLYVSRDAVSWEFVADFDEEIRMLCSGSFEG